MLPSERKEQVAQTLYDCIEAAFVLGNKDELVLEQHHDEQQHHIAQRKVVKEQTAGELAVGQGFRVWQVKLRPKLVYGMFDSDVAGRR